MLWRNRFLRDDQPMLLQFPTGGGIPHAPGIVVPLSCMVTSWKMSEPLGVMKGRELLSTSSRMVI